MKCPYCNKEAKDKKITCGKIRCMTLRARANSRAWKVRNKHLFAKV